MEEKFGTIIIDGKIVNIDKLSEKELDEYIKKLEKREKSIREELDELLSD
ncbi:MAG TPA: hypothetical protein OIM45_07815 [Clostridiaceae bacterium]|nr:hypothetical protein [Clostridiaceae bacterium]